MTNPISGSMLRSLANNAVAVVAGAVAALSVAASHSIDLYAIYDQLNVVVADIAKLIGMVTPIATLIYAAWRRTPTNMIADVAADPDVRGIVTTPAMAASISSVKVQPTVAALPQAAKRDAKPEKP